MQSTLARRAAMGDLAEMEREALLSYLMEVPEAKAAPQAKAGLYRFRAAASTCSAAALRALSTHPAAMAATGATPRQARRLAPAMAAMAAMVAVVVPEQRAVPSR